MPLPSNRIGSLRLRRGWELDDLASRAHVGVTTLRKLESGETRRPRESTAHRIASAFGVPVGDVFPDQSFATVGHDPIDHGTCDDCGTPAPHSMGHCVDALQTTVEELRRRLADDVQAAYLEGKRRASAAE